MMKRLIAPTLAVAAMVATPAWPQSFPERPVTIVVGAAAGSSGDLLSRLLAQRLSDRWKQPVVVENRSGGSGLLALREVMAAPATGYTLFMSNDSTAINQSIMRTPPPDPRKALAPINLLALIDFKLLVAPTVPATSVRELIDYLKANPGKRSFSSSGLYTPHHLMAELFKYQAGVDVLHVPYRGTAPSIASVLGGQSDYAFSGFPGVDGHVKAGKLRALATTGAKRSASSPELPTVGETLKGFSAASWWAMSARPEVPAQIQQKLSADVTGTIAESEVNRRMREAGLDPIGSTPAELRTFLGNEIDKWAKLPAGLVEKLE